MTAFGVNAIELPPASRPAATTTTSRRSSTSSTAAGWRSRSATADATCSARAASRAWTPRPPQDQERGRRAAPSTSSPAARTATSAATASCPRARRAASVRSQPTRLGRPARPVVMHRRRRRPARARDLRREPPAACGRRLPDLPEERATGTSASTACRCTRLGRGSCARSAPTTRCTPTSARGSTRARRSASRTSTVSRGQRRVPVSFDYADESDRGPYPIPPRRADRGRSQLRRRPPRDRGRPRPLPALRAVRRLPARRRRALDAPARGRSGTCARTACARAAGPRPTPPACRSCPGLARYDEVSAGASTTRCASPASARAGRSSTRPATSPRTRPTRTCRRWASGCGCKRGYRHLGLPAPGARSCCRALKRYGMILADNGSPWFSAARRTRAGTTTSCSARGVPAAPSRSWTRAGLPRPH